MKVKDLIKELEKYPKNMEVKLHNGFVDDWQHFTLKTTTLEKYNPSFIYEMAMQQSIKHNKNNKFPFPIKKQEWIYVNDLEKHPFKKYKNILLIDAKLRDKTNYDRLGTIHY